MFWGLTLESGKRYAQKVESSFHVSMAALDLKSAGSDPNESVSVVVTVDKNDYLICNLSKSKIPQQVLDLNFETGDQIAFMTKGKGIVHLTGFLVIDDDFSNYPSDLDDEGASSEEEDIELPQEIKKALMKQQKKRKNDQVPTKAEAKKAKVEAQVFDDSDEEDSDFDEDAEEEGGSEEEEEDDMLDAEAASGEDEEDDEEDESGEEEEDESDESIEAVTPPKMKQQQQQQQKNKTPNKTPIVNGNSNEQQSGKKNKKDKGGESPKGQTPKSQQQQQQQQQKKSPQPQKSPGQPGQQKQLPGGVIVEDLIVGNGPVAKAGRAVKVYYVGRLKHNNKQFDAAQSGAGFKFNLGRGDVIKGWDVGVQGMKVGGKRKITCPPAMAYGTRGSPPTIPPNCPLVFEVELKSVT